MRRSAQTETIHNVFVTDDGEVIEEMTDEQEQEIYEIPNGRSSRSSSPPQTPQRRSLLQHISSITKVHGNGNNSHPSANSPHHNNHGTPGGNGGSTSGRLLSSYNLLEEEYCKLKFEQTELVALADQRKMEKQRSAELMESLEEDLMQQRTENAKLRYQKEQLQEQLQIHRGDQRVTSSSSQKQEDHTSNRQLRKLWLQRDVARQKLEEAIDELQDLRLENKRLLDALQVPPKIPNDEVKRELFRMKKEHKVAELEKYLQTLSADVARLRPPTKVIPSSHSAASSASPTMIGKEIMVDEATSHSNGHLEH
ncbi:hypothetical protein MHU86_8272 [Fragilaria crotonensis]|nr:hypothetical protein MHU86_8272 [Fragilaria crotonensis]